MSKTRAYSAGSILQSERFGEVDRMEEWGAPNSGLPAIIMEKRLEF